MKKSQLIQLILTFLFGPLGLFYSSLAGGLALTIAAILLAIPTGMVASVIIWFVSIIAGFFTVSKHNIVLDIEDMKHKELVRQK